jgi:putative SOS response-associated peptidase YedK
VQADHVADPLEPDYNVAPTKPVYGVLTRRERGPDGGGPHGDDGGREGPGREGPGGEGPGGEGPGREGPGREGPGREGPGGEGPGGVNRDELPVTRQLRVLRWGLVPSWAKDPSRAAKMINARVETVATKPAFRRAFARRRCLLPADGFYEWQTTAGISGPARKQPFYMSARDGGILAMAGLYELWRVPDVPAGDPAAWLWTATIITTGATDQLGHIHDRMPMVVERGHWSRWLDPVCSDPGDLSEFLTPAAAAGLDIRPVSPAVNNVRNNGPGLIDPAPPGENPEAAPASLF